MTVHGYQVISSPFVSRNRFLLLFVPDDVLHGMRDDGAYDSPMHERWDGHERADATVRQQYGTNSVNCTPAISNFLSICCCYSSHSISSRYTSSQPGVRSDRPSIHRARRYASSGCKILCSSNHHSARILPALVNTLATGIHHQAHHSR